MYRLSRPQTAFGLLLDLDVRFNSAHVLELKLLVTLILSALILGEPHVESIRS